MSDTDTSKRYRVEWAIDIDAADPVEAARKAREHQTRPGTTATVFEVLDETGNSTLVDLTEIDEEADSKPSNMRLHQSFIVDRADGTRVTHTLCGRESSQSTDGMNIAETADDVTCKLCLQLRKTRPIRRTPESVTYWPGSPKARAA